MKKIEPPERQVKFLREGEREAGDHRNEQRPTIYELEEILANADVPNPVLMPDGSVEVPDMSKSAFDVAIAAAEQRGREAERGHEYESIDTAPKDGTEIFIRQVGEVRVFWCNDLKRWVLSQPVKIESIWPRDDLLWRHHSIHARAKEDSDEG